MSRVKRECRTLTIRFHAAGEELADIQLRLDTFVDRLVFDDMGLPPRVINLIRMLRGQVAVLAGFINQEDYELSVKDFKLDSNKTGW